MRCDSLEDLYEGKVRILELNGCGAEPGHIYDADFTLWHALKVPVVYWDYIYRIARANKRAGVNYASFREAWVYFKRSKSITK